MPNYFSRQDPEELPVNNDDKLSTHGMGNILDKPKEEESSNVDILGGSFMSIMNSNSPHKQMIDKVLKLKPKEIHLIKKGAKYFLDHQDELSYGVPEEALEDLSKTRSSNDLADMLENDFEFTQGGEELENSLLESLGLVIEDISKHSKFRK